MKNFSIPRTELADMDVHLTSTEIEYCQRAGQAWHHRDGFLPREQSYLIGLVGEYALAKHLRLPVQFEVRPDGDDGYDLVMERYTIQVKSTARKDGRLMIPRHQQMTADLIVLTIVDLDRHVVKLVGWIDAFHWQFSRHDVDLPNGSQVWITPTECLYPISQLEIVRFLSQTGCCALNSPFPLQSTSGRDVSDGVPF